MRRVVTALGGVVTGLLLVVVMITGWSVGRGVGVAPVPAEASTANRLAGQPGVAASGSSMPSSDQMDALMAASMKPFPARTAGAGGQPLTPDPGRRHQAVRPHCRCVAVGDPPPGRKVEAWTYNGTVPGPSIQVAIGDRVAVVLHNRLPESTAVHFHGIQIPFADDGTPFVSQPPIKPGKDFTYRFTPTTAATGLYHSHDDAVKQMPNGLYGAITVGELALPAGVTVTGDNQALFLNDSGTIGLTLNGKSFPATAPFTAKLGQWIEVTYYNAGQMSTPCTSTSSSNL